MGQGNLIINVFGQCKRDHITTLIPYSHTNSVTIPDTKSITIYSINKQISLIAFFPLETNTIDLNFTVVYTK